MKQYVCVCACVHTLNVSVCHPRNFAVLQNRRERFPCKGVERRVLSITCPLNIKNWIIFPLRVQHASTKTPTRTHSAPPLPMPQACTQPRVPHESTASPSSLPPSALISADLHPAPPAPPYPALAMGSSAKPQAPFLKSHRVD